MIGLHEYDLFNLRGIRFIFFDRCVFNEGLQKKSYGSMIIRFLNSFVLPFFVTPMIVKLIFSNCIPMMLYFFEPKRFHKIHEQSYVFSEIQL